MKAARSSCFIQLLLCFAISAIASISSQINVFVGIKFISFNNYDGTTVTGACCDQPGKAAGSCSPNMCDTAFAVCGTRNPSTPCDVLKLPLTPVTYNSNKFTFGKFIGKGKNKISRFKSATIQYDNKPIDVSIKALEAPDIGVSGNNVDIAEFHLVINWVDPKFNAPPKFRSFVLNDTRAQLEIDVFSQCKSHYYGATCSGYCKAQPGKYKCSTTGTIQCLPGFHNPICLPKTTTTTTTTTQKTTSTTRKMTTSTTQSASNVNASHQGKGTPKASSDDHNGGGASTSLIVGVSIGALVLIMSVGVGVVTYLKCVVKKKNENRVSQSATCDTPNKTC